ncbi:MAG: class I SAM-dependent methyltransferase [Candidatus Roizmanbacteria bacterium]|nr:MAG: class I SAM-dependent methyltransferase [Candidatus Roizmanbacteria bacterium]
MHLIYHKTCRICHSPNLNKVIDLGEQYLQNVFVKKDYPMPSQRKIPTMLMRCDPTKDENACGLLQLAHTIPPQILYSTYWYRSGTNQTMRFHLKEIADEAASIVGKKRARVLDIGCNDGTLLKWYPKNFIKVGIDPSDATKDIKDDIAIIQDIFPSVELEKKMQGKKFDIITSIAMFYDVDDPVKFAISIKNNLAPKGLWIFEMYYMPNMLKLNSYDTICHEHLSYYSMAVIEYILKKADLKMIKVSLNNINGGSIRCYATHTNNFKFKKHEYLQTLKDLRHLEFDMELDTDKPYKDFQERILAHREELTSLLKKLKREGNKIHIYGASTKGNTVLQFCSLDHTIIDYAADRNPQKHGASTLGSDIPIISEEESRAMKPDYYLVLPWSFKQEFLKREKKTISSGVKMIFPFPKIEIIEE